MTAQEFEAIIQGSHGDPFSILGPHQTDDGWEVRAFLPQAMDAWVATGGLLHPMRKLHSDLDILRVETVARINGRQVQRSPGTRIEDRRH